VARSDSTGPQSSGEFSLGKSSELDAIYLLQLVDQYPSGLWARSLQLQEVISKELERARRAANPEGRVESISYTFLALQSILRYTADPNHPAVRLALTGLQSHRSSDGGYSSLDVTPTIRPEAGKQHVVSARHTAGAGLSMLLVPNYSDEEVLRSARVILGLLNADGAWGNGGDPYGTRSECLSTALTVEFLFHVKRLVKSLSRDEGDRIDGAINSGAEWLDRYFGLHSHWRIEEGRGPVEDTAWVLSTAPCLAAIRPGIQRRARSYVASHQSPEDFGWPPSPGRPADLRATTWAVRSLDEMSSVEYEGAVKRGLSFISSGLSDTASVMSLDTGHWSTLLWLGCSRGARVSATSDEQIQKISREIQEVLKDHPTGFRGSVKSLLAYPLARAPVQRILVGSSHEQAFWDRVGNPIESLLDQTPRWVRWLVGAILLALGVGLPIYFGVIR
jgi:hypothetical protein